MFRGSVQVCTYSEREEENTGGEGRGIPTLHRSTYTLPHVPPPPASAGTNKQATLYMYGRRDPPLSTTFLAVSMKPHLLPLQNHLHSLHIDTCTLHVLFLITSCYLYNAYLLACFLFSRPSSSFIHSKLHVQYLLYCPI